MTDAYHALWATLSEAERAQHVRSAAAALNAAVTSASGYGLTVRLTLDEDYTGLASSKTPTVSVSISKEL